MDKTVTSSKPPVRKKPKMESGPSTLKDFFKVKVEKPAPDIQLDICIRDREVMAERYEAIGQRSAVKDEWQKLLAGPAKPPMCNGHSEPCALRTVKKAGPNLNRQFYVCARPTGKKDNPAANCEHFQWITKK